MKVLCSYGCEQEANFKMKNGKICCSEFYSQCLEVRRKNSKKNKGRKNSEETKKKKKESSKNSKKKYRFKKGNIPWNKDKTNIFSKESLNKISQVSKGNKANLGRKFSVEWKEKIGKGSKENYIKNPERKEKIRNLFCEYYKKHPDKFRNLLEQNRCRMKNGGSIYANKFVKNPSKPQIKIHEIVKEIFNSAEIEFSFITNEGKLYRLDEVIPEYKIVIEYDGSYWHQDLNKDLERQRECEDYGWKFIRYLDKVPTKEQLKKDINKILNGG